MKKKAILILAVCAMMAVAGCSKKTDSVDSTAATGDTATDSQAGEQTAPVQEEIPEITTTSEDMKKLVKERVTLGGYTGLEYNKVNAEVSEEEIEAEINRLLSQNPVIEEVTDRAVADGDSVNIDFVGKKDGVAFDGGAAENYELLIGSNSLIEGFETGLIGANIGDTVDLNLTFPENYGNADLDGKAVVFTVTINGITKSTQSTSFDDAFVARISTEHKTADEYKAALTASMQEAKAENALNQQKGQVLNQVLEASQFGELPKDRVDFQVYYSKYQQQYQASMFGMTLDDMLAMYGVTPEQFEQQCQENAEYYVKQDMVMYAISAKEKIEVTDEDLDAIAKEYQFEDIQAMYGTYGESDVYEAVLFDKVMEFLYASAVEGPEAEAAE